MILYAASLPGDKTPVIQVIFLYFIGRFRGGTSTPAAITRNAILLSLVAIIAIYFVTIVQYPEMSFDEFMLFIFERLGIGQIQGVYEQFALRLQDSAYIVSEIPLSGLFGETRAFSKDLMAATYGFYMNRNDFGVMNSFFIGEAYAIGGWPLVWIAPIVVGINFCMIAFLVVNLLARYFKIPLEEAKFVSAIFVSGSATFTGDLGGLLFGKRFIVIGIMFVVLYLIFQLTKQVVRIRVAIK